MRLKNEAGVAAVPERSTKPLNSAEMPRRCRIPAAASRPWVKPRAAEETRKAGTTILVWPLVCT